MAIQPASSTAGRVHPIFSGLRVGARSLPAHQGSFDTGRTVERRATPAHTQERSTRSHVINADVFKEVVIRERKRADRANRPFVLLLISARAPEEGRHFSDWRAALEAVTSAKRETDLLGWFEQQSAVGVVLTEIETFDPSVAREISRRVRQALAKQLGAETASDFSIRLHVHPDPATTNEGGLLSAKPILQKLRPPADQLPIRDAIKRVLDVMGSFTLLMMLSPLLLLIASLVRLTSRGPVFFRQVRVGQDAKAFTILKFRTMRVNVDHALHQEFVTSFIKSGSSAPKSGQTGLFKIVNDPRITPIGSFLRKTSLDELPQFWNVLRGEMSLVGPRPPIPYEVEQYASWHRRRVLEAKPGITGLWQVKGRSRTTFDEMVRLDLRYARTYSLWTDLKILFATPMAVIAGKGAC
jgi:lipopolysaccharide/colanic/teichoic acid biosynthesis glycosyltransferase